MANLVILMIEKEQPEGLSARKLVVETAKHNVLTAYSATRGLGPLRRFPKVDSVLVHKSVLDDRDGLLQEIRHLAPGVPIILASPLRNPVASDADHVVDSLSPGQLLLLLNEKIVTRFSSGDQSP